jgi:5-methylcytosine-specific restriction endonuclease McrA
MESFERLLKYASLFAEAAGHPRANYMREYMKNRYHSKRNSVIDRLGGKCSRCGTTKGPWHLDHKNKKKKTMRASDLHSVNDKKFEQEIKNLQLLCEKCHREKTKESWDYSTPKPRHGTYWMYRKHGCRCPRCVKAYKEKQKEWRARKKLTD